MSRSYRNAETAPNGRIRVTLDKFKKEGFHGTVGAAARELNRRFDVARAGERKAQIDQFHGGLAGQIGLGYNPHDMSKNPALSKPITAQDVERVIKTLP